MPPTAQPSGRADRYVPETHNTRALLRSLEELRDSLSTRVEQLSEAVERLRHQAVDMQRAFGMTDADLNLDSLSIHDVSALSTLNHTVLEFC